MWGGGTEGGFNVSPVLRRKSSSCSELQGRLVQECSHSILWGSSCPVQENPPEPPQLGRCGHTVSTAASFGNSSSSQRAGIPCCHTRNYRALVPLKRLVGNNAEVWKHWWEDCCWTKLAVCCAPSSSHSSRGKAQVSFQIKQPISILHVWFDDRLTLGERCCKICWINGRSGLQDRGGFCTD